MTAKEKERYRRYLIDHYSRLTEKELNVQFEIAVQRIVNSGYFSELVIRSVISEMISEKYTKAEILAHIDLVDIKDRI